MESLIDCKDGPSVEELGLSYLESESGPIHDREEAILDGVRTLFMRTGGEGAAWEALEKFLEAVLNAERRQARRRAQKQRS